MDCCICSPIASVYRLPRNSICASCHQGARAIIGFLNKEDDEQQQQEECGGHGSVLNKPTTGRSVKPDSTTKGMRDAWEQVKAMRGREEEAHQRAAFLAMPWKEGHHTDIVVKPGTGPPISAHRAILATRSEVFRHMLAGDERCKAPAAAGEAISLPELTHDELALLLAFLYTGALEDEADDQIPLPPPDHGQPRALLVASDKYDVPFLRRACEARLAAAVDASNALRTLEVAELSSSAALRERAMATVLEHAQQVVFSPEHDGFAARNAGLCVDITRALLLAAAKIHGSQD